MTSVEKRRSGRKGGGHRKHSDGGYSDTSSGGSFLDETDREVSNLTDRAFRSLCIGDEAVYNDSDLCSSSPCLQRDRQLAFSQDRAREEIEREELKRAAHEGFSLRVQQYGQNWMHGGTYGAEIQRDPQWGVHGERTQGRVSATFQHSFVEMSQQEKSLNEEQLSFFSNGPTELGSQQRRSRSRVSSLIRAFNSEGQRDGAGLDVQSREWNDETSWDKSALMSIQRELSEFSTPYQQNFDSGHFPPAGPFLSQDTNFYSSEVAAMAHMNSTSSFMRSSHSMLTQVNCNSNFFIHSEFSPFRVWRDHNRFPFQQGEVSGFMHCSEFPKWCETPMYKELSQGRSMFEERRIRHQRNTFAPMVPPTPSRSTSTSTMLQKASAVENRSESELSGHYPYRKRTQSLGSHRLPPQRPSTASPTIEMSRRVRDTISSVKALQQRIKMMTEQNIATELTANTQGVHYNDGNFMPYGNNMVTVPPNVVSNNASTNAFNISHVLTPRVHAHQETLEVQQYGVSPQPVEHPPVRAESRGATPDVRMSSYRSRATSLLFNLKDNRKRVKSTYSPTKFKGLEMQEKSKQSSFLEPRDTVIDMPEFTDPEIQIPQVENSSGYYSSDYQTAQIQDEMVHHSGLTGYIPENNSENQLANGQNLHEDAFTHYKQGRTETIEILGGDLNRHKPSYRPTDLRPNAENNQIREYLIANSNTQQQCNEAVEQEYTNMDRYQPLKDYSHDYSNAASQDKWRQTNNQDTEKLSPKATISPWKQTLADLMEKDQPTQDYQKTATKKESKEIKRIPQYAVPINDTTQNPSYGQQHSGAFEDKEKFSTSNNNRYTDQEYGNKHSFCWNEDKTVLMQETGQSKQHSPPLKEERLQPKEGKQQFEHKMQKNSLSVPDKAVTPTIANDIEVNAAQDMAEQIKAQHTQAELANAQPSAQVEEPKAETAKVVLAGRTCSEQDSIKQMKAQFNMAEKAQADHNEAEEQREKQRKEKQAEQPEENRPREELIKTEQARVQSVTEGPRNVTEKARAMHTREEQGEGVKVEQANAERLKEEHLKLDMEKNKQAKTEQAKNQKEQVQLVRAEKDERGQTEAEEDRLVKVKAELPDAKHRKSEEVKLQQMKLQQAKKGQEKPKVVGEENVKADHKVKDVTEKKSEETSIQVDRVNAQAPKTEKSTAKEVNAEVRKAEQAKFDQSKMQLGRAELLKTQKLQEWSAKSTAVSQHSKNEPSKVEQVKTELAKAKAELAKIKNKMKGDQKEKVRSTVITKVDDNTVSDVPSRANISKNEEQDRVIQINKQKKDSGVSSNSKDRGADDYETLREKYGLSDEISTNQNKTGENISSNVVSVTPALALDNSETTNAMSSIDEYSPASKLATPKIDNKEESSLNKSNVMSESQYIYSESSKEFKLSSANHSAIRGDKRRNSDSGTDKKKDDGADKLEKGEHPKHADVSQQRVSDSSKPLERKPKFNEHSVVSGVTPPKALFHKERLQTKQEILTSKIKAHAEKEISAIKEKGFALRDGFPSKNSNKLFSGSQSINIRQKPPPKRHENTMPNNTTTPKQQMGPSGLQMESISLPNSAATTTQVPDPSQKLVPKETLKSTDTVPEAPKETKQSGSHATSTDGSLIGSQKNKNQAGFKSPIQNKDWAIKNNKGKQEVEHGENSENLKEVPVSKTEMNTEQLNKNKATSNHEMNPKDSSPSLKLFPSQNDMSVADDSLQIMGIMVTVRERMNDGPEGAKEQTEPDKCHSSSGVEINKENESSMKVKTVDAKDRVAQETNQNNISINSHPQNLQETSARKDNVTENATEKLTPTQQESYYIHARPQREIQPQEPLAEKDAPPSVTVPAKNKVLAETQPHLKQDIIAREKKDHTNKTPKENLAKIIAQEKDGINTEEKNPQTTQTEDDNKRLKAKMGNIGINFKDDVNRPNAENLIKHEIQQSVKEDMTTERSPSKSRNKDEKYPPLLKEKRYDSTPPKTSSKTDASNHLTENENRHVPVKHQHKETHSGENIHVDTAVHIDSIAINVVPPVTEKDNQKMIGKHRITAVHSDVVKDNDRKQDQSSSHHEKVNPFTKEDHRKDPTPPNSEQDKLESNQPSSKIVTKEKTQTEIKKPKKVKENETSKTQPMGGDYFQIQGVIETKDEPNNKSTNVGNRLDEVSNTLERPNIAANSKESYKEGKYEAFAFDQSKMKAVEICPVSIQDENMKTHSREMEDKTASKPSDCPTERQSSKCENMDASQAIPIRKHQTESKSSLLPKERHIPRNSQPTRENAVKENPEVKPKPKERVSTIPDISALADYARLKVIVSEETANTIQESPPNKKEGFFPLIQAHHSRRPVFTADTHDLSMKEKRLPSKTEVSSKVNKEPKAVVFPITEKQHQRTGMFKLGEKERQENMLLQVKDNEGLVETGAKHAQDFTERKESPQAQIKNQEVVGVGSHRVGQADHQKTNHPTPSVNNSRDAFVSQHLKPSGNSDPQEKTSEIKPNLDRDSHPKSNAERMNLKESKTNIRKDEKIKHKDAGTMIGEDRREKTETPFVETTAKLQKKQFEEAPTKEVQKKAESMTIKKLMEESRASQAEEERRVAQREEERRAREKEAIAIRIRERREKQKEAERRAEEERKAKQLEEDRAAQKEEERRAKQREEEGRIKELEKKMRTKIEEERRAHLKAEEKWMKEMEEKRRVKKREGERVAQEEQQKKAAFDEEQRRKAKQAEEEKRLAHIEEERKRKQREEERAAQEEQQKRAAQEEQQKRAAQEEQQKRAAQEEQQKRAAQEEQQKRAAQEEQQKRAAQEEQQKRAAQEEQQKRAAHEEQRRKAKQIEEEKRLAYIEEERKRKLIEEERAAQEEQRRKAKQIEEEKRLAHIEEERRRKQREEERAAQVEQQKRAALMEEQRQKAKQAEEEKRLSYIKEERKRKQIEEERAAQEEQRRIKQIEEEKRLAYLEEERKRKQSEQENARILEEKKIKQIQEQKKHEQIEEQRRERYTKEEWIRTQKEENWIPKQQAKEMRVRLHEEASNREEARQREEKRIAQEQLHAQREEEIRAKKKEEQEQQEEARLAAQREEEKASTVEEQKRAVQRMDALQYYAITSTESERKPRQRQPRSPIPSQQRSNTSESTDDSGFSSRPHSRSHASASPAPSLPRSNTSSPALGAKPLMFRVKDNTLRGSPFTKSVKPRFHKNFGEDFSVGSPMEKGEEEQELMRRNTGTPVHPETTTRLAAINESSILEPAPSSQDYSAPLPPHRPFSRRSLALDEEDSRSVISYMSEDVESFATSGGDLADIRGLYDNERPESACSFSSDVSRLGKPPVVPPKSEKALLRAKRLTRRRMKKEQAKTAADSPAEKSLQEVSSILSSSPSEVWSHNRHAVASPHFSPPVSLAHAPALGSSLPSSQTEQQHSHRSFHATPHATTAVSLPVFSPRATTPVSLPDASPHAIGPVSYSVASPHAIGPVSHPVTSPHAIGPVSHPAALKTVAHVPSSPTLYQANHPAPVTQYHVESRYPQSYPLTQRKVLQDIGSGQYFVVDVPVQVKTKTFFDPETGSYVQLNVRESGQSNSRSQSQQKYPPPQLQPQTQAKQQQQPLPQASPVDKPFAVYQGYSQGYQPTGVSSAQTQRSPSGLSAPTAPLLDTYRQQASKSGQNSEGHRCSPERTPYMDTVNDKDRTHNTVYNAHGSYESFPECDTNRHLAGSSVCENDNSAHSRYQPRDIITMGDLEDFMEVSDW